MKNNRYYTNKNGYRQHYNPSSPEARKSGFSPVHRDVARKKYNRDIKQNEVVHHKDGNKLNNSWDNIELMNRSEHTKYHNSQRNKSNNIGCLSVIAIISLFILLCTLLFTSCKKTNVNTVKNHQETNKIIDTKEETKKETELQKIIMECPEAEYDHSEEAICWNRVDYALSYDIFVDGILYGHTKNTFIDAENLTIGYHMVSIIPINTKNKNIIAGTEKIISIKVPGIKQEDAILKAKNELQYSMVYVEVEKYNTTLGFIKTDKKTDFVEGILVKKNGQTYWILCYSSLLNSNKNFDKTKIEITDAYGNQYEGTEINPTNTSNDILSVISFTDSNKNKSLPIASLTTNPQPLMYNYDVMLLSRHFLTDTAKVIKISNETKIVSIDGRKTKYQAICTNKINGSNGIPVLDENYNLIGISIETENDYQAFIQTKEMLEYIDSNLAANTPYTGKVN